MNRYPFLENLEDIPVQGTICIYGAGGFGKQIKDFINKHRPEVLVACFADTHKRGEFEGLSVIDPQDLLQQQLDYIFIASMYWQDIIAHLPYLPNIMVIRAEVGDIFIPSSESTHPWHLDSHHAELFAHARALFSEENDRQLYDYLIQLRCSIPEPLQDWAAVNKKFFKQQYLDNLKYSEMKLVIEGGVFDGSTAQAFLERMPMGAKLIGFEPFPDTFVKGPFVEDLSQNFPGAIQLEPMALWESNQELFFQQDAINPEDSGGASKVIDQGSEKHGGTRVQGVRLDDYVQEKGLDQVSFIKMDIEGAEISALEGARHTISTHRPQLAICIYHTKEHLYQIPLLINEMVENYQFRLGHYSNTFWETVFYAIPNELT